MMTSITRLVGLAVLCGAFGLAACSDPPPAPEQAVRDWVEQGEALAEEKDRRSLVDMIAPSYTDARGNSRDDIENMFRIYFLRANNVSLLTSIDNIEVHGDTAATLTLTVGMAGTTDSALGFNADAYNFEMELELRDDEWLLYSARWGPVGRDMR